LSARSRWPLELSETAGGKATAERQAQIASTLAAYAITLACVALGAQHLSDELKKRILSTFLTLMVARENLVGIPMKVIGVPG
jgi:hypothetical protein